MLEKDTSLEDTISLLQDRNRILSEALSECEYKFSFYAVCHLKKNPADYEKAKTNIEMAEMCREAMERKIKCAK